MMSSKDLAVAQQFLGALEAAAKSGDRDAVYPFLAPDVEWSTPQRDLHGVDDVHESLTWLRPPETLDIEFEIPALTDLGDGRVVSDVHETYRMKETGAFAYACDRRIELTIRDARIARYEMRVVG
jgi:ketosteroid isomerase-like protein